MPLSEGVRPLHHSHVGGVFETEEEISALLDELGFDLIGLGPDTGHLRWAGIDPAPFIARYADRIGAMHIKDCFPDHLDRRSAGRSYRRCAGHQAALGRARHGIIDFDAVMAACCPMITTAIS